MIEEKQIREEVEGAYADDYGTYIWSKAGMLMQTPVQDGFKEAMKFAVRAIENRLEGRPTSRKMLKQWYTIHEGRIFLNGEEKYTIRGWGRIQYYTDVDPAEFQDALALWICDALNQELGR